MSFVDLADKIAAKPFANTPDYEGVEYRWKFLTVRPAILAQELPYEPLILAAIILYVLSYFTGKLKNSNKAAKWHEQTLPILQSQFSAIKPKKLTASGNSDFMSFATGRRNIETLHTVFALRPRHDLLQWLYQVVWGFLDLQYRPVDSLELIFTLEQSAVADFVFAVVKRDELRNIKDARWDLAAFTKTAATAAGYPTTVSVMSEYADVSESILKSSDGKALFAALEQPEVLEYFRSISITDQPRERPSKIVPGSSRRKQVILSLIAPPPAKVDTVLPLLKATFAWIDSLSKVSLRVETRNKIKKFREDTEKEINKEAAREKAEEAADAKAAAKRKARDDRLSKLSSTEQQKVLDQEKKKQAKKQQKVARK